MKNHIIKIATLATALIVSTTACKKEVVQNALNVEQGTEFQIEKLAKVADANIYYGDVMADESTQSFGMETEGIHPHFLVDETDLEESQGPAGGADHLAKRKRIVNKSFIYCLRKQELDKAQIIKIKAILSNYKDCKYSAVQRARAIYNKILGEYQAKFKRYIAAYNAGKITKEELKQAALDLRKSFAKELKSLQLKDKVHVAFKSCYVKMLRELHGVLSPRQWNNFKECLN
jgi:hypothetical protein